MTDRFRSDGFLQSVLGARALQNGNRNNVNQSVLEETYFSRGIAATIVDRPASDALSSGVSIENDEGGVFREEFDRLNIMEKMGLAMRQALLHGSSALLPMMDDTADLTQPVDFNNITQIREFRVIIGPRLAPDINVYNLDPLSEFFGLPEVYNVSLPTGGGTFKVHVSRLIPVAGEGAYMSNLRERVPWEGRSALASAWVELRDYQDAVQWALLIMERKQNAQYKMKGLADLLAANPSEGELLVQKRIALVDQARNVLRSVVVDSEDEFTVSDLALTGIDTVINKMELNLAAAARMPTMVLFGEAPKGFGATGTGELTVYHSRLTSIRSDCLYPAFEKVIGMVEAQKFQTWPKGCRVTFNPLWSPTEKEEAEAAKFEAEAEKLFVDNVINMVNTQLISPEEGRMMIVEEFPEYNLSDALPEFKDPPLEDTLTGGADA